MPALAPPVHVLRRRSGGRIEFERLPCRPPEAEGDAGCDVDAARSGRVLDGLPVRADRVKLLLGQTEHQAKERLAHRLPGIQLGADDPPLVLLALPPDDAGCVHDAIQKRARVVRYLPDDDAADSSSSTLRMIRSSSRAVALVDPFTSSSVTISPMRRLFDAARRSIVSRWRSGDW
jgi:hypothetical protein